jgi:CBS domain-containing protein
MDKPVSSMMATTVWTVDGEDTIAKVEELLNRRKLSAVPVVDAQGGVFGILSLADVFQFHAAKRNPKAVRAWELCTYKPITVPPETPIASVAQLMIKHRIHHVVVAEGGKLCGIVSALDFVEQYVLKRWS